MFYSSLSLKMISFVWILIYRNWSIVFLASPQRGARRFSRSANLNERRRTMRRIRAKVIYLLKMNEEWDIVKIFHHPMTRGYKGAIPLYSLACEQTYRVKSRANVRRKLMQLMRILHMTRSRLLKNVTIFFQKIQEVLIYSISVE